MSGSTPTSAKSSKGNRRSATFILPGRENKIYRTPPTPPPEKQQALEQGFVTDNIAVSSISGDYSQTNPKLGSVIPPFNSQKCRYSREYFKFHGVDRTLRKTGQVSGGLDFTADSWNVDKVMFSLCLSVHSLRWPLRRGWYASSGHAGGLSCMCERERALISIV